MRRLLGMLVLAGCKDRNADTGMGDPDDPSTWAWNDLSQDRVLFFARTADVYGNGEMYLLERDGTITEVVDNSEVNYNPSITPDGSAVAFHRWLDPDDFTSLELYMVSLASGVETRLTEDDVPTAIPKWNADGDTLVYTSWSTYGTASEANVMTLDLSDWSVEQITTDGDHEDNDPSWCGDDSIAFKSLRNTQTAAKEEIHLMGLDGSDVRRLSTITGWESDHDPRCSPEGEWVYFYRYEATRAWTEQTAENWEEVYPVNIWRVDRDGNQEQLTDCEHLCGGPVPGRDGTVAYVQKEFVTDEAGTLIGSNATLMVMDADGSHPRELLPTSVYEEHRNTLEWFDW